MRQPDSGDGLERVLRRQAEQTRSAFEQLLGFRILSAKRGEVSISGRPDVTHDNTMGRTHGGFAASMLDTAMGYAVLSEMRVDKPFGTVQLNVHYTRKIDAESGILTCHAQVQHQGRSMTTVAAKIVDASDKLCAHGTGTFLVYPK